MLALQLERPIYEKLKQQLNAEWLAHVIDQVATQANGLAFQQIQTTESGHLVQRQMGWLIKAGLVQVR
jgi:hypothetical protein